MSLKKKQKRAKKAPTMESSLSFLLFVDRTHGSAQATDDSFGVWGPKQLYQVIDQNKANADQQSGTFFSSEMVTLSQVQQTRRSGSRRRRECLVQGSASVSGNR
jgi:hypothetical protein